MFSTLPCRFSSAVHCRVHLDQGSVLAPVSSCMCAHHIICPYIALHKQRVQPAPTGCACPLLLLAESLNRLCKRTRKSSRGTKTTKGGVTDESCYPLLSPFFRGTNTTKGGVTDESCYPLLSPFFKGTKTTKGGATDESCYPLTTV